MYFEWCKKSGFPPSLEKTRKQLEQELARAQEQAAELKRHAKLHRNPRQIIEAAFRGEIKAFDVKRPQLKALCETIECSRTKPKAGGNADDARELFLWALDHTDFLLESLTFGRTSYPVAEALLKIHDRKALWLRPLEAWEKPSHNAGRQFSSLLRHLFAKYPVPHFMDQAWVAHEDGAYRYRDWFIHIGLGHNIRTANTPVKMTKMMAHHFLQAPDSYRIEDAFRWGEVHALGGDKRLTEAILGSRLGAAVSEDEFWTSVIKFFVANPMLDRRHVGPIVDYLHDQKYHTRQMINEAGELVNIPPPQPNLTMRGRTAASLLVQVERWHGMLARVRGAENVRFKLSGHKPGTFITGSDDRQVVWTFRELLNTHELIEEGRKMKHCVSSYARSCVEGRCSIWAMEAQSRIGLEKCQTLEVSRDGAIVQCRGRQNRYPTEPEISIVKRWAEYANLTISPYALPSG
jgi:hypothetical protein